MTRRIFMKRFKLATSRYPWMNWQAVHLHGKWRTGLVGTPIDQFMDQLKILSHIGRWVRDPAWARNHPLPE